MGPPVSLSGGCHLRAIIHPKGKVRLVKENLKYNSYQRAAVMQLQLPWLGL